MSKKKPKVAPAGQAPPSPPAFKGLARDTLVLFILLNLFNLVNFLYHFIIARILTPADYGILATLIAIVFIFAVSSEAIQNLFSRLTSKLNINQEEGKIKYLFKNGIKKALLYSSFIFVLLLGFALFLSQFLKINFGLLVFTNSMLFLLVLAPVPRGILQGKKDFLGFGSSFVIEGTAKLVFSIILVFMGFKVFGALAGIFLGLVFGLAASVLFLNKLLKVPEQKEDFSGAYKFSIPFFITNLVMVALLSIDIILARRFFAPEIAGNYAVLSLLGKIIFFATSAVGKSMFPAASERFEQNQDTNIIFKKSLSIILALVALAVLFYAWLPEIIVRLSFGQQYLKIAPLLVYSGIALSLLSCTNLVLLYGLSIDRLKAPGLLILFFLMEVALLSAFHSNLKEYITALLISNAMVFSGSIMMIRARQ